MKFEMPSCTGCKTCQMVCSFKHTGVFNPSIAAISILEKEDDPGFLVSLRELPKGGKLACVGCLECISYCPAADALAQILLKIKQGK